MAKRKAAKKSVEKKTEPGVSGVAMPHWQVINKFYPPQFGFIRRIIPLWDTCYRVNFHCPRDENRIYDSYFVDVNDLSVKLRESTLCTSGV